LVLRVSVACGCAGAAGEESDAAGPRVSRRRRNRVIASAAFMGECDSLKDRPGKGELVSDSLRIRSPPRHRENRRKIESLKISLCPCVSVVTAVAANPSPLLVICSTEAQPAADSNRNGDSTAKERPP